MITTSVVFFSESRVARRQQEAACMYVHLAIQEILPYTHITYHIHVCECVSQSEEGLLLGDAVPSAACVLAL